MWMVTDRSSSLRHHSIMAWMADTYRREFVTTKSHVPVVAFMSL